MAAPLAHPQRLWLGAALVALLAACGGQEADDRARFLEGAPGDRLHLLLEGPPRELGRGQGRLLKERIGRFHEAFQRALLAADGDLLSPATKERRRALLGLLEPARNALPEAARQELKALAEAAGLPEPTLLLSEMLTDLLRFGREPGALVTGRVERTAEREAWLTLEGPLAVLLQEHLVWITRRATADAPAVTVLAWPGSLGGLIAVRADGLALLAVEEPLESGRQGLAGVPFDLSLRLAAERATDARAALGLLSSTTAHRVLACDLARGTGFEALAALAGEEAVETRPGSANAVRAHFGVHHLDGVTRLGESVDGEEITRWIRAP